jgi:hypothetical protein
MLSSLLCRAYGKFFGIMNFLSQKIKDLPQKLSSAFSSSYGLFVCKLVIRNGLEVKLVILKDLAIKSPELSVNY